VATLADGVPSGVSYVTTVGILFDDSSSKTMFDPSESFSISKVNVTTILVSTETSDVPFAGDTLLIILPKEFK
jgi:hypothetical protein